MEIVEKFREISQGFNWGFDYGRKDFHNLIDEDDSRWHLFLDPVTDESNDETMTFEGYFMLLSTSDYDQNYDSQKDTLPEDGKWLQNIKPKKDFLKSEFKKVLGCDGRWEVLRFRITEIINFFDNNMDGVLVNFSIKYYL